MAPLVRPQAIREASCVHTRQSAPGVHAAKSRNKGFSGQALTSLGGEAEVCHARACVDLRTGQGTLRGQGSIVRRP